MVGEFFFDDFFYNGGGGIVDKYLFFVISTRPHYKYRRRVNEACDVNV